MKVQTSSAYQTVTSSLFDLSPAELRGVAAMITGLLEALEDEAQPTPAEADPADGRPIGGSPRQTNRPRGHWEYKLIPNRKNGKTYGPYKYLRFWHDGKLKSVYKDHKERKKKAAASQ